MDSSLIYAAANFTILGTILFLVYKKFRSNPQNNIMASSSSLSLPPPSDVFLNFHGPDVGRGFLSRIMKEFRSKGTTPFIDNEIKIGPEVIDSIRGSRIAIVMLSRNYASSSWCLDELVEIIKCREELGQVVVPIFYQVDSIDVKKQTGDFGNVFRETCNGTTEDNIENWSQALTRVATIAGYHSRNWVDEMALFEEIATHIANILKSNTDSLGDDDTERWRSQIPDSHDGESIQRILEYLAKGSSEVRQERIITNYNIKEVLYTSERAFKDTVCIYCEDRLQYSFASHLSINFRRKCIDAFVSCNETLDVIEGASAAVVVFSKSCLSSTPCLNKLMSVLQWRRRTGLLVVPVFYGISSSDVVVQEHESADRIRVWNRALQELRELPGHHSREKWSDCELVDEIIKDVYEKLFPTQQIGINSRLLEIEQLLCKQPWGIRRIGIWGMPGIGKTTLAKAVFEQISGGYEASCFIKHFDEAFQEKGLHRLLEEHFGGFFKELPHVCSSITRPSLPDDILSKKRTLVVLDDVHNPLVAESFLRGFHWFGPGSLIIITSRDKQVFRLCQINHVYDVESLNEKEALQLFTQCVGKDIREQDLLELSMEVIDYANGNPLALSFYGKELKGKKLSEMETLFLKFKLRTPFKIHDLFNSSYKTLTDSVKNIFLDIACFFVGEDIEYVTPLLEGCGVFPHVGIDVLLEKCLVTITANRVKMHRIIQDFGRELINRETVLIERRRRLWEPWTIKFLLEDDKLEANEDPKGTEDIEGIYLDTSNLPFDVKPTAFENMLNLRLLKIYCSNYENLYGVGLPKGLQSLPCELRLLHWENYPLQSLPQDFDPSHLVELNMSYSHLQKLWRGSKNLDMLKVVRLCHSQQLTEIDDICKAQNIELIDLQGCTKLQSFPATGQLQYLRVVNISGCREIKTFPEVSPNIEELGLEGTGIRELITVGKATNLKKLNLTRCASLVELPFSIGNATNLQELNLGRCSKLVELPSSIGNATNLQKLDLGYCSSLVKLPSSIGNATNLQELNLGRCSKLVELPSSIGNATNLQKLDLGYCSSLVELPSSIGNATSLLELNLAHCSKLVELPSSIGNATNLQKLDLGFCSSLVELPSSIGNAINLQEVNLKHCIKLVELSSSIGNATNLQKLDLGFCSSLVELSSIGNAINLQEVNLEHCIKLVELPSSIENATNLRKLDLGFCSSLVDLSSIGNATNLQQVNLEHCISLVELPSSIENATNLRKLDLGFCSSLVDLSSIGNATNLQEVNLENCIKLVELPSSIGNATNLKKLNLGFCSSLVELSSIGNATNLQEVNLEHCISLVELPSSIGNATNLRKLDLGFCSSLVELSSIGNATNLQELFLGHCTKLVELPSSIGNATSLRKLDLGFCSSLVELSSIGNATNLQELYLGHCTKLVELPSSIGNATSLRKLDLGFCSSLVELSSIGNATNLQELYLGHCTKLMELPSSIGNATNLRKLDLGSCSSLVKLPSAIGNATNLQELYLRHCTKLVELPISIGNATNLQKLDLEFCSSLVKLPSSIGNISNLQELNIRHCIKLVELPSSIRNAIISKN